MLKVENISVFNFDGAIRGMRNPYDSWDKSDSGWGEGRHETDIYNEKRYVVGENDLDLMRRLYKGGSEHRKYLRQIFVSMDIIAPLYFFKELDTYKVGTVANSCSTMHTIHKKKFTLSDFSCENITEDVSCNAMLTVIDALNFNRDMYLDTKDKKWWWNIIQLLPTSYNQRRTITMNYENVISIIKQRTGHRLDEWKQLIDVLKELPYIKEITE